MILRCRLLLLVLFIPALTLAAEQSHTKPELKPLTHSKLKVVATIRPLHSLLSFIMQGTGEPLLLLDQSQSVHHYSLRPSQRSTLAHADILFWVGEALETFMPRVLTAIPKNVQIVELIETKNLLLLEPRAAADGHKEASEDSHHGHHHEGNIDPHIWLSIDNALLMAAKMTDTLSAADPAHAKIYQANFKNLSARLKKLKNEIRLRFKKSDFNYLVYHDAFQYFEQLLDIKPLAAISTDEEQAPGVRHLSEVNHLIASNKVECLIYNTPTLPSVTRSLLNYKNMQTIFLDPLGQNLEAGSGLYFELLNSLAKGYQQCQKSS